MSKPVPPKFQPEMPRKPQAEGNRPIPPPASLAMPELPPQAPPKIAPPTLAMDARVPTVRRAGQRGRGAPAAGRRRRRYPICSRCRCRRRPRPRSDLQPQLTPPSAGRRDASARRCRHRPCRWPSEPQLEAVPLAPIAPSLLEQPSQAAIDVADARHACAADGHPGGAAAAPAGRAVPAAAAPKPADSSSRRRYRQRAG